MWKDKEGWWCKIQFFKPTEQNRKLAHKYLDNIFNEAIEVDRVQKIIEPEMKKLGWIK